MYRLAGFLPPSSMLLGAAYSPAARTGQDRHRLCRGLDEERARRHRRRLYREDRHQDRRQLCRKFGAGKTDRAGRAGRRVHLRRHRLDGLCDRQEEHQRADPGQSARQQHRADRAERFQNRQCDHRRRLRPRQTRRRRQDRHRRRQSRAGRQIRQGGAGEAWRVAGRGAEIRDGGERARRADAGGARRSRRSASSIPPTPRSSPASRSSAPSRPTRIRRSSIRSRRRRPRSRRRRTISPSCARRRRRPSSRNTASSSWSARRPDVRDLASRMDGDPALAAGRRHCDAGGDAVRHRAGMAAGAA